MTLAAVTQRLVAAEAAEAAEAMAADVMVVPLRGWAALAALEAVLALVAVLEAVLALAQLLAQAVEDLAVDLLAAGRSSAWYAARSTGLEASSFPCRLQRRLRQVRPHKRKTPEFELFIREAK